MKVEKEKDTQVILFQDLQRHTQSLCSVSGFCQIADKINYF